MNFNIKITTPRGVYKGGQGLNQYFGTLFNSFENIVGEPEMDAMGEILRKSNMQNIVHQRKADGSPLGIWAPATAKARARRGGPFHRLYITGNLLHSIESDKTGRLKRTIESKADYSGALQFAKSGKWRFFGAGKIAMSELQKYLTELLVKRLRNAN